MSRIYIGHLPARCTERDIERFFKGYGRLRDVVLKNGYGFVEFDNEKDADDAVYDLHGRELRGERIIVEHARLPPGSRGGSRRASGRDRRYGPPTRTEYRVVVENLSSRVSWQDLKDMMRKAGDVTYADAHKSARNDGIVEFSAYADMKEAIEKFDGYELYGRRLHVHGDRTNRRSLSGGRRSRSGSRQTLDPPGRRYDRCESSERQRSTSRSRRDSRKRSRELSGAVRSRSATHRSESHHSRDRSISHHSDKRSVVASRSPSRNGRESSAKNGSDRRSRTRSASVSRSRSRSRSVESRSPVRSRSRSGSRSRSHSISHHSRSGSERHHSDEEMDNSRRSDYEQDGAGRDSED
ncbi:hypothetical protein AHF37_05133 [Paragonimus kellicotti]|nr:hypothetical protein AHF37_05133 [Paragonimus kellicotti]